MRESFDPFDLDGGAPKAPEFSHARGTRQESVEGPDMWNQVLDSALRKPAARWEAEGIDFDLRLTIAEHRIDGTALLGVVAVWKRSVCTARLHLCWNASLPTCSGW